MISWQFPNLIQMILLHYELKVMTEHKLQTFSTCLSTFTILGDYVHLDLLFGCHHNFDLYDVLRWLFKAHIIGLLKFKRADIRHL